MNGNTQKLFAYVALVIVAALLLVVWGLFAFYGKTDISAFIAKLSELIGIVVTAISTLGGVHIMSNAQKKSAPDDSPAAPVTTTVTLPTQVK